MGFRVWSAWYGVRGVGFRVGGSGFRVWGSGCGVQGSGCGVQGVGLRVFMDGGSRRRISRSEFTAQGLRV
jgi:hypothetical protein